MSVLYAMDANYNTLVEAEAGELVPQVDLPAKFLTKGMVLRGKLTGKTSTPGTAEPTDGEYPKLARIRVSISPQNWGPSHSYKVGDLVRSDGLKQYRCLTAGVSDSLAGPTGRDSSITDGTVTWQYARESPVILDTGDMALDEMERLNVLWVLDFEINVRLITALGDVLKTGWYGTVVTTGRYSAGNFAKELILPTEGPYPVVVETTDENVLHVLYTPDFDTGEITCMTYVLEVL